MTNTLHGWWTISAEYFMEAMRRAHAGEDPDMLYAEYYANSDVTAVKDLGDE